MKGIYREFLFEKGFLEGEENPKNPLESLLLLGSCFGIEVTSGQRHCDKSMIPYVALILGEKVPEPFYKGFPESVKSLSGDALLLDQLIHYWKTYGLGDFSSPGRSEFESAYKRLAFKEKTDPKPFIVLSPNEAEKTLKEGVIDLAKGSRPLSDRHLSVIVEYLYDNPSFRLREIGSKNLSMRLLLEFRDYRYLKGLCASDILKVLEILLSQTEDEVNLKKLNLHNADRKFLSRSLDIIFQEGRDDLERCYERKALWQGFLHHIHYKPKGQRAQAFVSALRGKGNGSAYHFLEEAVEGKDLDKAIESLKSKGQGGLVRNLGYLASRFGSREDIGKIVSSLGKISPIWALQILYSDFGGENVSPRYFSFLSPMGITVCHRETEEEMKRRKSHLSKESADYLLKEVKSYLSASLKGRLKGKAYIDPWMKKIAVPISESSSSGGYLILPSGSRLAIPEGKKIRAFAYWEKVNDIDLSILALSKDRSEAIEYSWRTMASKKRDWLLFSGDQTSGFDGGSEYFDIDIDAYLENNPGVEYLVFAANVYSLSDFSKCFAKAGFMTRDAPDSGEVYEPKTVKTSFRITAKSSESYLFALDLRNREAVWLNVAVKGGRIAASLDPYMTLRYMKRAEIYSLYDLFSAMAEETTDDPFDADFLITDDKSILGKPNSTCISSADFEKIAAYLR